MLRIFKKRFLVEIKAKYFFIGAKMRGVETEWREARWRHWGWETSFPGLEVILQILRLGGHFCGDHGASAPPPSACYLFDFILHVIGLYIRKIITIASYNLWYTLFWVITIISDIRHCARIPVSGSDQRFKRICLCDHWLDELDTALLVFEYELGIRSKECESSEILNSW